MTTLLLLGSDPSGTRAAAPAQTAGGDGITYALADTWSDVPWEPAAGRYGRVRDISSAPDGTIYVLDAGHAFIHVLAPDGSPRRLIRMPDTVDGEGNTWLPCQLDVGFDGRLYLLSKQIDDATYCGYGASRVDRLAPDGRLQAHIDIDPDQRSLYADIGVHPDGRLYLSRFGEAGADISLNTPRAVDVFGAAGDLQVSLSPPELALPLAIDVAADGSAYVVNRVPDMGSGGPSGPVPTPRPSLAGDGPAQGPAGPIEGVLIFEPDHRYRETVPFVNARDVAVGPAGVFVSRDEEVYALRDRRPVYSGPGGFFGMLRLDVPADGRVLAGMNHCYFQGVVEIADPAGRPAPGRLIGALDRPKLEGPAFPLRLAASDEVTVLQGGFDAWGDPPDRQFSSSIYAEEPQTVQRWTRRGVPLPGAAPGGGDGGRGRLASQLGLCGRWDALPTRDVAVDGRDVYTIDAFAVQRRPDNLLPAWSRILDDLADPDGAAAPVAVAADGGLAAVLDAGRRSVLLVDRGGTITSRWPVAAANRDSLPVDIALAAGRGRVYLADQGRNRIMARGLDGADLGEWPTHDGPRRIAAGPDGDVYVLGRGGWGFRYRANGALVAAWPMPDRKADAMDIGVDVDGRVYVGFLSRMGGDQPPNWLTFGGFDILGAGVWVFEPAAAPPMPAPLAAACVARPDKRAAPRRIPLGDAVTVTLGVAGQCPGKVDPVQLAVVFDTSRSMNMSDALARAKSAATALLGELDTRAAEVALVTFSDGGTLDLPLGRDVGAARARVAALEAIGDSRMGAGIETALAELTGPRGDRGKRRVILVVTDGAFKDDPKPAATRARAAGIDLYAIVLWNDEFDVLGDQPLVDLEEMTGSTDHVLFEPDERAVARFARGMVRYRPETGLFETIAVVDEIPRNMRYVADSAVPAAAYDADARTLTWNRRAVSAAAGLTLTYRLVPLEVGLWPTNVHAAADYRDAAGFPGRLVFPIPEVEVHAPPAFLAYLPFVAGRGCLRPTRPLDAVLVLDTSSSMAEPAPGGGTKLDAARAAAEAFAGLLDLGAGGGGADRVGIVSFNGSAARVLALSGDRARVAPALAGLSTGAGTRIDLGLAEAAGTLAEGGRADAQAVVILLTDGLQTESEAPNAAVVARAEGLKAGGALVYTIGLGGTIDRELLRAVATSADRYYESPTTDELAAIYRAISARLACEGG